MWFTFIGEENDPPSVAWGWEDPSTVSNVVITSNISNAFAGNQFLVSHSDLITATSTEAKFIVEQVKIYFHRATDCELF
jgi:hypothetical protein